MRRPWAVPICLSFCVSCTLLPPAEKGDGRTYGLFYGASVYQTISPLGYPDRDAADMRTVLGAGMTSNAFRTNLEVTRSAISNDIRDLAGIAGPSDTVFFFFSGHGYTNGGTNYLVPSEATLSSPATMISDFELADWFSSVGTFKKILILDHCFSGDHPERYAGLSILTAGSPGELTWEFAELGHGVLTYCILLGLTNRRADILKDGRITVSEAFYYAEPLILRYTRLYAETQHPRFTGLSNAETVLLEY